MATFGTVRGLLLALGALALAACASRGGSGYDAELARSLGADEHGMRGYVFVLLKTGPNTVPAGAERDAMFQGHFANIQRLAVTVNETHKRLVAGQH